LEYSEGNSHRPLFDRILIGNRTGSGKSTLALSFFRFVEPTEGKIVVDGLDISQVGLTDLRSKLTIIPREYLLNEKVI
jgi:ABC-type multidrug transport system fused ATPase/permease subunit